MMGYYTYFTLTDLKGGNPEINYEELVAETFGIDFFDSQKWYDYEKNMIEFSRNHPDVLFLLERNNKESNDFWKHYFKNGKSQFCRGEIVYDTYDETKLI